MALNEREILERLRDAVVALKDVRAQRDALLQQKSEPIAIIGMACRFPGGANTPEAFFDLLTRGVDTVTAVPHERWTFDARNDADPRLQGARWGAFTNNIDLFDAPFFGISPREAERMDPQQRFLLELTWEALERAGIVPATLSGTKAGVFVGILNTDYYFMNLALPRENQDAYSATGNGHCFAAGRLAYTFGLQGPTMSVDTACSSSLVAAHLACQSLRARECDLAVVCGVNHMLFPLTAELIAKTGALAPDGRCKSFDALANGIVRGEGCGVIVLKRLSDAQRDGDPIIALIRGSTVNQDGRSTGLTTPNVLAQEAMLKEALENAQLKAEDIGFIEAHGTGTPLGDPIELDALCAVFGKKRTNAARCWIGSVKTNIGHLEAAAGIAGLIKAALALHQEKIPANLHFRNLNPRISLQGTDMAIAAEMVPWPRNEVPRRAGVSSFGMSGTNGHVILEEAPAPPVDTNTSSNTYLLPISAKTPEALVAMTRLYLDWLKSGGQLLHHVAYTASLRRSHHEHRIAVIGSSNEEIASTLDAYLAGQEPPGIVVGKAARTTPEIVFVFPGQGTQATRMGKQLFHDEPIFRDKFVQCSDLIQKESGVSILDELDGDRAPRTSDVGIVQPLIFAIQVSLVELWRAWGVEPSRVVGHSMGEVAAAHASGALSIEDAVSVICRRSRLLRNAVGKGAMALVEFTIVDAERAIQPYEGRLSIAVSNSPHSTVIAGDPTALNSLLRDLEATGKFCQRLKVDVASHSPQMESLRNPITAALSHISSQKPLVPMYSTVTGERVQAGQLVGSYWADNLRKPVLFSNVVTQLIAEGKTIFLEMSPHPTLIPFVGEALRNSGSSGTTLSSLRYGRPERQCLLSSLSALHVGGYPINWKSLFPNGGRAVNLPTYPWQWQRYWLEQSSNTLEVSPKQRKQHRHPFLDTSFTTSMGESKTMRVWQSTWSLTDLPYLADHRIGELIIVPGAAYVESALAAARDHFGPGRIDIEDLVFATPLVLNGKTSISIEVALSFDSPEQCDFRFSSRPSDETNAPEWRIHARARIFCRPGSPAAAPNLAEVRRQCSHPVDPAMMRATERSYGINIGPAFEGLKALWQEGNVFVGRVEIPDVAGEAGDNYFIHPILLDSALRALMVAVPKSENDTSRVLLGIRSLRFWGSAGSNIWNVAELPHSMELDNANVTLYRSDENAVLMLEGIETGQLATSSADADFFAGKLFCQQWLPMASPNVGSERIRGRWLLLCDASGFADDVQRRLAEDGAEVIRVQLSSAANLSPSTRTINPGVFGELAALIAETTHSSELAGIIHCCGVGQNAQQPVTRERLLDEQESLCAGALHLVQAIIGSGLARIPPLWLIVRGTQTVESESEAVGIVQAPLWGLGRALAAESSDVRCFRLDLDPRGDPSEAQTFRDLLRVRELAEDEVAIRNGRVFVGRLEMPAFEKRTSPAAHVRADASYLITGGLGGLGLIAAKWLAESGAKYIALMSRRGVSIPAQTHAIQEIEALGAQVLVLEADVGIAEQLSNALDKLNSMFPPLRGILHAAGFADVGVLEKQTLEKFRTVFGPKVVGTWNLYELTQNQKLDFFILYSSMAALFGSLGVSNYVAANAFLDTFASYLQAQGRAATSINWGWFEESGKKHISMQNAVPAVQGFKSFNESEGKHLLNAILHQGWLQMGLLSVDMNSFVDANPHLMISPRFGSFLSNNESRKGRQDQIRAKEHTSSRAPKVMAVSSVDASGEFLRTLNAYSEAERLQRVDSIVREQLGHVLHMNSSLFNGQDHLQQYGVDSLMTIELRNRLQSLFRVRLSITDIWSQGNISSIASFLVERLGNSTVADARTLESTPKIAESTSTSLISSDGWLVTHKAQPEAQMRLICFPYAGGGAPIYASWPDHLPSDIEIIAVQPPGRYERIQESPPQSIGEIVDALVPKLLPHLNLPFAMFGHCLGAMMMFEVARRLEQTHGMKPLHLFASGASPPQLYLVPNALTRSDEDFEAILRAVGFADQSVLHDDDVIRSILPVVRSDFAVAARYDYRAGPRLNAPVTAFVGDQDIFAPAHIVYGWQAETSGELTTHTFAGGHYFLTPERQSICRIIATDMEHDQGRAMQIVVAQSKPEAWMVRLEARAKPRLRVFCCPGIGGDISRFEHLAGVMPPDVELCAFELPGHGKRANEFPLGRIDDLISCIASVMTNWLDRPFVFLGLDLGALVLYEVMRRIRSSGGPSPKALIVLGAMAPHLHYFAQVHHLSANMFADTLRLFGLSCIDEWSAQRSLRADCAVLTSYQYRDELFITTPIVAFVAEQDELIPPMSIPAWQRHTMGRFDLHRVQSTHSGLLSEAAVLGTCYFIISEMK